MRRLLIVVLFLAWPAWAGEGSVVLAPGPGLDKVKLHCATCHSLDYILMNSPFLERDGWQKEVDKMVNVMGAPIPAEDRAAIVDYLSHNY